VKQKNGFLAVVLHAHLPYVKHPELEDSLQERWLFQALTECYIPLLTAFGRLVADRIPFRVTVSLSPPLLEMLADPLLRRRYKRYLDTLLELGEKEVRRTASDGPVNRLARDYTEQLSEIKRLYNEVYKEDLAGAWEDLSRVGAVELITSAATHGYLPLLLSDRAVGAQIRTGLSAFRRHFGENPKGFWLPECAYCPEVEPYLREEGVSYFILETHGVLLARPRPKFGFHAPIVTPHRLAAFGRDPDCSKQVWSADEGYPGDGAYRDFYRDIGYELPAAYLGKALPSGQKAPTGFKYHRVTDRRSEYKEIYNPADARGKAAEHAANFLFWREREAEHYRALNGRPPIMMAPYDAELFGHWWYEGPVFLENLFRFAAAGSSIATVTPTDYLALYPVNQVAEPATSSWGYKGYNEVWLEGSNDWVYRHLHACQDRLADAMARHRDALGLSLRALHQAARELLLAQASDWPFIMKTGSVPEYAKSRFTNHIGRFSELLSQVEEGAVDPVLLGRLEEADGIFAGSDLRSSWLEAGAV
jgi:1,4-alpha-glucan branching enzyme